MNNNKTQTHSIPKTSYDEVYSRNGTHHVVSTTGCLSKHAYGEIYGRQRDQVDLNLSIPGDKMRTSPGIIPAHSLHNP